MNKLMSNYKSYIARIIKNGGALVTFNCPVCEKTIKTLHATEGEVWNTFSTCPYCENLFIKITTEEKVGVMKL